MKPILHTSSTTKVCPVTVIVPEYNEADWIADTVGSLLTQSLAPTDSIMFHSLLPVLISFGLLLIILISVRIAGFFSSPRKSPVEN
jgi:hypothetical protein